MSVGSGRNGRFVAKGGGDVVDTGRAGAPVAVGKLDGGQLLEPALAQTVRRWRPNRFALLGWPEPPSRPLWPR